MSTARPCPRCNDNTFFPARKGSVDVLLRWEVRYSALKAGGQAAHRLTNLGIDVCWNEWGAKTAGEAKWGRV